MSRFLILLGILGLAGCTSNRVSRYDEFEKVKVDKMVGNAVRLQVLGKTLVCLNAMREARWPEPLTNETVVLVTNYVTSSVTNLTITTSSNHQLSSNTNAAQAQPLAAALEAGSISPETNPPTVLITPPQDSTSVGVTTSTTSNESVATAPYQTVTSRTTQRITVLNQQATVNTNHLTITGGTNLVITVETNAIITTITNPVISSVTNTIVTSPGQPLCEYYLYTEIAPQDFTLQAGESLVVLVDGQRYGLTPAQPGAGWTSRRGFTTTFYKAAPELIAGIANAHEVRLRIKGANGALERKLSRGSRQHFRDFLVWHFGKADQGAAAAVCRDS